MGIKFVNSISMFNTIGGMHVKVDSKSGSSCVCSISFCRCAQHGHGGSFCRDHLVTPEILLLMTMLCTVVNIAV